MKHAQECKGMGPYAEWVAGALDVLESREARDVARRAADPNPRMPSWYRINHAHAEAADWMLWACGYDKYSGPYERGSQPPAINAPNVAGVPQRSPCLRAGPLDSMLECE